MEIPKKIKAVASSTATVATSVFVISPLARYCLITISVAAGAVAAPMAPRAKQYVNISRYDLFKYLTIIGEKHIVTPVMTTTAKKLSPNAKAIGLAPTLLRKLVLNSHPIVNAMKANSIFTIIFNASTVFMAIMPSNPGINPNNPGPRSRPVNK